MRMYHNNNVCYTSKYNYLTIIILVPSQLLLCAPVFAMPAAHSITENSDSIHSLSLATPVY